MAALWLRSLLAASTGVFLPLPNVGAMLSWFWGFYFPGNCSVCSCTGVVSVGESELIPHLPIRPAVVEPMEALGVWEGSTPPRGSREEAVGRGAAFDQLLLGVGSFPSL